MTTLMYRGSAHDGSRQSWPVAKKDLIYRGVHHTGHTGRDLKPMHACEMIYRGVRTVRTLNAAPGADPGTLGFALPAVAA